MAGLKPILRLGCGWLLMLAGAVLIVDGGLPSRSNGPNVAIAETLAGFVLAVIGWVLRRTVLAKPGRNKVGSDRD
jgi:hypothetical protein